MAKKTQTNDVKDLTAEHHNLLHRFAEFRSDNADLSNSEAVNKFLADNNKMPMFWKKHEMTSVNAELPEKEIEVLVYDRVHGFYDAKYLPGSKSFVPFGDNTSGNDKTKLKDVSHWLEKEKEAEKK
jgi:hypothetical protein